MYTPASYAKSWIRTWRYHLSENIMITVVTMFIHTGLVRLRDRYRLHETLLSVGLSQCEHRLSELWYFRRKNKRPVHDLTPSICNMFAMCTSCREKSGHLGRLFLCNMHSDQRLVKIMGIIQNIGSRMLSTKIVAGSLESDN